MTPKNSNKSSRIKSATALLIIPLTFYLKAHHQKFKAEESNQLPVIERSKEKSLAQIIRRLIDLPQLVAAGGSRGKGSLQKRICLISPLINSAKELPVAYTIVSKPVIATRTPLNEIIIREAQGKQRVILRKTASITEALKTPIYWPLEKFSENSAYILEIRPLGAARAQRVQILWKGAENNVIKASERVIQTLYNNQDDAMNILENISRKSPELAIELAFNKKIEQIPEIKELRMRLKKDSCQNQHNNNNSYNN